MDQRPKKYVLAAAAALACVGAQAADYDWGSHAPLEASFLSGAGLVTGLFQDKFSFTLDAASTVTAVAVANNNPSVLNLIGGTFALFSSADAVNPILLASFSGSTGSDSASVALDAGDYYYRVFGLATGTSGGYYSLSSQVTAVPEPETYALLLGGLGVIGFMAARRREV